MPTILQAEVALTSQNQITIPVAFREILKIEGGKSRVRFQLRQNGDEITVVVVGMQRNEDAALRPFLELLAEDLERHPERIRPVQSDLVERAQELVKGIDVDLDGPLTGED